MTARKKFIKRVADVLVYGSIFLSLSATPGVQLEKAEALQKTVEPTDVFCGS